MVIFFNKINCLCAQKELGLFKQKVVLANSFLHNNPFKYPPISINNEKKMRSKFKYNIFLNVGLDQIHLQKMFNYLFLFLLFIFLTVY